MEKAYCVEKYSDYVDGQNEKNRKARYYDRVKTIDGILENNKMCPEETLLQLENIDGTVLADVLAQISAEYSFQTIAGCSYNTSLSNPICYMDFKKEKNDTIRGCKNSCVYGK